MSDARLTNWLLAVIALLLGIWFLRAAQFVVLPVVLAVFLSVLIRPVELFLERFMPRFLAVAITFVVVLGVLAGAGTFLVVSVDALAADAPLYGERFAEVLRTTETWLNNHGVEFHPGDVRVDSAINWIAQFLGSGLKSVVTVLGFTLLVGFMLVLQMGENRFLIAKIRRAFRKQTTEEILDSIEVAADQFQSYFVAKTAMSILTGVLVGVACYIMGVKFAFMFGTLAFLLNFLPNIGSMIAGTLPGIFAFLQGETIGFSILVLVVCTVIELLVGNYLDPKLMGRRLALSPMVVFVSMVFWGWAWGFVGVFLAVPLTLGIRVVCKHVEPLRPVAVLMGDGQEALALETAAYEAVEAEGDPFVPGESTEI